MPGQLVARVVFNGSLYPKSQDLVKFLPRFLVGRSCCRELKQNKETLQCRNAASGKNILSLSIKNKTRNVCFSLDLEQFPSDKPGA